MTADAVPQLEPDPGLAAERLASLPARLRRRAEDLEVGEPVDGTVAVGSETVTLSTLTCSCLLSPRCAHVGAVCLTVPEGISVRAADSPPQAGPDQGTVADPASPVRSVKVDTELVSRVRDQLGEVLRHGLTDLPLHCATSLSASLQQVRVSRLHRLERALTGVVTALADLREGRPVNRAAVTASVTGSLLTCHLLLRGDPSAVGTARRVYGELGSATLVPIGAEPVLTASGFAGASVILAGPEEIYTLGRTPPGVRADVPRIWHGPAGIGDIRASLARLARHKVLISGGTVSVDGRLGSGKSVRAALGADLTRDDVLAAAGWVVTGTVISASRKGIDLNSGSARFSRAARSCGVDGLIARLRSQYEGRQEPVTVVIRDGEAVAVWFDDEVVYPGLDRIRGFEVVDDGPTSDDDPVEPLADGTVPTPAGRLSEWLELLVFGGAGVLGRPSRMQDAAWCEHNGAPLAAHLLRDLTCDVGTVLPLVVYGER
jgi:hypothetical protein